MGGNLGGDKPYEKIDAPAVVKPPSQSGYIDKNGKLLINSAGFDLVKHFEGCYLKAYQDSVGVWTLAWGRIVHPDGTKIKSGDRCTQAQADAWLLEDLWLEGAKYVRAFTSDNIEEQLDENMFSSLVGFTYNRGAGRYRDIVAPFINRGDWKGAMAALVTVNWAGADKTYLLGLDRRRWSEKYLFEGKDWRAFDSVGKFKVFKANGYKS